MSPSNSSAANVFNVGKHQTQLLRVEAAKRCSNCFSSPPSDDSDVLPPKQLLIATPSDSGEFPLLLILHGYLLDNCFYSQLIQHIASHGFIVIAPQLYVVACMDATGEIESAAAITNWLSQGLSKVLPQGVQPNLSKIAMSGHSRGGKAAFALLLGKVPTATTSLKFSALIGIDPVDGTGSGEGKQTTPPVLTYEPHSFDLDMPVMVIGSGLGEVKKCLLPACAPKGVNHEEFFSECRKPACYFVVKDYGHLDMLDDETKGIRGKFSYCLCKSGSSREPMRLFVGGVVVAFLKAYLEGDSSDLVAIRFGYAKAPVELQKVEFLE